MLLYLPGHESEKEAEAADEGPGDHHWLHVVLEQPSGHCRLQGLHCHAAIRVTPLLPLVKSLFLSERSVRLVEVVPSLLCLHVRNFLLVDPAWVVLFSEAVV